MTENNNDPKYSSIERLSKDLELASELVRHYGFLEGMIRWAMAQGASDEQIEDMLNSLDE